MKLITIYTYDQLTTGMSDVRTFNDNLSYDEILKTIEKVKTKTTNNLESAFETHQLLGPGHYEDFSKFSFVLDMVAYEEVVLNLSEDEDLKN